MADRDNSGNIDHDHDYDNDITAETTFEWVLPRFEVLAYLHTFSSYLTPDALRKLPPELEELHIDVFRCGSEFCDPEAVLAVFHDKQVDLHSLRVLTVYSDEPGAVRAVLAADIVEAAAERGVRLEWCDSWEGDIWNRRHG
jgi:hypothetical protein